MSKLIKGMMVQEYQRRFQGVDDAVIIDIRALNANANNQLRNRLQEQSIRVTVLRNRLARQALAGTGLDGLCDLLTGPSALVYGGESVINVARALVEWARKIKGIELKSAVLDGTVFEGRAGVEALSRFPTRDEARAQIVQIVLSPGSDVVGVATGPGAAIAGIIAEIEERLENNQAIAKIA